MRLRPTAIPCPQDNFFYRTAAHRLYPVIADYADPALDKLVHSPYYSAVVDHLKPAPRLGLPQCLPALHQVSGLHLPKGLKTRQACLPLS